MHVTSFKVNSQVHNISFRITTKRISQSAASVFNTTKAKTFKLTSRIKSKIEAFPAYDFA